MKIFKAFLLILFGIALGIAGALGFYYLTVGELAWQAYVEEKLIPNAVFVISSISTIALLAAPFIKKILLASDKFSKATEDVNATINNDKKMVEYLKEYREEMGEMMEEFRKLRSDVEGYISPVKTKVENIERVVHLGFEHESQLVADGWAKEIAKVGNENEQK